MSTLCFRRFRSKHTELNKIYWTHRLGIEAIVARCRSSSPSSFIVNECGAPFQYNMLPLKASELGAWADDYLGRSRLHILLVCAANLEAYLKEVTFVFLMAQGYASNASSLNPVGKAMGAPILERNSLPDPLDYAEGLFQLNYGEAKKVWAKSYKLRCALAHNGGVVTARTLREIPDIGIPINSSITVEWQLLFDSLEAADEIATATDQKVASKTLKIAEIRKDLQYLKDANNLPSRKELAKYLQSQYRLSDESKCKDLEYEFYW